MSVTSCEVGTTTIRLGATRQGPSAPDTCQLGKYETFTSTGVPTRSTWKLIELSVWVTWETVVACSGTAVGLVSPTCTRVQSAGPSAAGTTFQGDGTITDNANGRGQSLIVNDGVIDADVSGQSLVVDPAESSDAMLAYLKDAFVKHDEYEQQWLYRICNEVVCDDVVRDAILGRLDAWRTSEDESVLEGVPHQCADRAETDATAAGREAP